MRGSLKVIIIAIATALALISVFVFVYYFHGSPNDESKEQGNPNADEIFTALEAKAIADKLVRARLSEPVLLYVGSENASRGGSEVWIFDYFQANDTSNQSDPFHCQAVQVSVRAEENSSVVEDNWWLAPMWEEGRESLEIKIDSDRGYMLACENVNVSRFLEEHEEYLLTMEVDRYLPWAPYEFNTTWTAWNLFFNSDLRGYEGADYASIIIDVKTGEVLSSTFHEYDFEP